MTKTITECTIRTRKNSDDFSSRFKRVAKSVITFPVTAGYRIGNLLRGQLIGKSETNHNVFENKGKVRKIKKVVKSIATFPTKSGYQIGNLLRGRIVNESEQIGDKFEKTM